KIQTCRGACMAVYRPCLMLLAILPALVLERGVAAQSADDLAMAKRLVGTWRLVETTITNADGTSRSDPRTTAYLLYSDTGITCYVAMDPTRAAWKSETTPTPEEALAGMNGRGAYCGTFRVGAKAGSLVLRMEIERIPNLVGRDRI